MVDVLYKKLYTRFLDIFVLFVMARAECVMTIIKV